MNLEEYKIKIMKLDDYGIFLENDKLVNEIYRLEDSLAEDRKKYPFVFSRGRKHFRTIEKGVVKTLGELKAKTNVLAQAIYSVR